MSLAIAAAIVVVALFLIAIGISQRNGGAVIGAVVLLVVWLREPLFGPR